MYLKMMRTIILIILVNICITFGPDDHLRLIWCQKNCIQNKLMAGQSLYSTMGQFKAQLQSKNCSLRLSKFNGAQQYLQIGTINSPLNSISTCDYISINAFGVFTENQSAFLKFEKPAISNSMLLIDDQCVLRLIGSSPPIITTDYLNGVNQEILIDDYKMQSDYRRIVTNLRVGVNDQIGPIKNDNGWMFKVANGLLTIYKEDKPQLVKTLTFIQLNIMYNVVWGYNLQSFPAVAINNITLQSRCNKHWNNDINNNINAPFVFQIDPYWPVFRVYDSSRYLIVMVSFVHSDNYYTGVNPLEYGTEQTISVCPRYTFQHHKQCLIKCPQPYFHQIRNDKGFCVLTCQQETTIDFQNKTCGCNTKYNEYGLDIGQIYDCPINSDKYLFGCVCTTPGMYYDRRFTLSCVKKCPFATINNNDGLCLQCPGRCTGCKRDQSFGIYLSCTGCVLGYYLWKGVCVQICNPSNSVQIIGQTMCTTPCADIHCLNCSQNALICTKCKIMYTLMNNVCNLNCDVKRNQTLVIYSDLTSVCINKQSSINCIDWQPQHFTTPVIEQSYTYCTRCQPNYYIFNKDCYLNCPINTRSHNNYCVCSDGSFSWKDKCGLTVCPLKTGLNLMSMRCQSCSFGCLTCINMLCLACQPGMYLKITQKQVNCYQYNAINRCDLSNYTWHNNDVCALNTLLIAAQCLVSNCKLCRSSNVNLCLMCIQPYILQNNACKMACLSNSINYNNVCIQLSISDCMKPYLYNYEYGLQLNGLTVSSSQAYKILISKISTNDPPGFIALETAKTTKLSAGITRITSFDSVGQLCLRCNDGMGLSIQMTQCLPCPSLCLTCYYAYNFSCITFNPNYNITIKINNTNTNNNSGNVLSNKTINSMCLYIDYIKNQCLQSCSQSPTLINGTLFCVPNSGSGLPQYLQIDSSVYVSQQSITTAIFIFSSQLQALLSSNPKLQVSLGNTRQHSSSRILQRQQQIINSSKGYIVLKGMQSDIFVVNLTSQLNNIIGKDGTLLASGVYGVITGQSHVQFMKAWLAYIGYFMGIVIITMHVIFVGNSHMYKTENLIILAQTIYLFSFCKLLVGKVIAQFYYGFIFTYLGFYPNYFNNLIPAGYMQANAPNSYKLATLDANFIRNCGYMVSLFITFITLWGIYTSISWIAATLGGKSQFYNTNHIKYSLIAAVQFTLIPTTFWAMSDILYSHDQNLINSQFHSFNFGLSIIILVINGIYSIFRLFRNSIGGIYCFKKIGIAIIISIAASSDSKLYLIGLCIIELLFTLTRYLIEKPELTSQKFWLGLQFLMIIACQIVMYLTTNTPLITILCCVVLFIFCVGLGVDIAQIYLQSKNQWLVQEDHRQICVQ